MRMLVLCSVLIATPAMAADDPARIGDVSTTFRMVGRNEVAQSIISRSSSSSRTPIVSL